MTARHVQVWSWRYSTAHGWRWLAERGTDAASAPAWLAIFRHDEPGVLFKACARTPAQPRAR